MEQLTWFLGVTTLLAPGALVVVLGLPSLLDRPLSERVISRAVALAVSVSLLTALAMFGVMAASHEAHVEVVVGEWTHLPGYHFSLTFLFDRLSVPFVILSLILCGTVSAFAARYMHREPGFNRFFVLYALFVFGITLTSVAGTIETLFTGWELVGLSSALLVAFFHERAAPVRNGLRVWAVYRVADAAFLVAAVVLHHFQGEGDFQRMLGEGTWPGGRASLNSTQALLIGLLLLVAAAGKSGLVPFSGWLPRAMEGPTPSSAVFYGSLSVHLGAYLLLRVSPVLESSMALSVIVILCGLASALLAALVGRVQTDIKSALAFASLTQVAIIVAEIGVAGLARSEGWSAAIRFFALAHLIGHACLRTLQFVRAPTLLHDYRMLENAIGQRLAHPATLSLVTTRSWLYRWGIERGYLDASLDSLVVHPLLSTLRVCDAFERRWTNYLNGDRPQNPDRTERWDEPI